MPQPFQNKQIRIVPHLGQNNQSIELGIDTNEAFRLDDADYSTSKEGAVKKRHPTHKIVQTFGTPSPERQLYLLRLYDFIFRYTADLTEEGDLINPQLYWAPIDNLAHHAGEWEPFQIPPQNHYYKGIELRTVPQNILSDPNTHLMYRSFTGNPPGYEYHDLYLYLINDRYSAQAPYYPGRSQILWTRKEIRGLETDPLYYTAVMPFEMSEYDRFIPWNITLVEDESGYVYYNTRRRYHFILEDTTGSRIYLGWKEVVAPNTPGTRWHVSFVPILDGGDSDIKNLLPGMYRIWIFRTTHTPEEDEWGDSWNIFPQPYTGFFPWMFASEFDDNRSDLTIQDYALIDTYYLGGIHPSQHPPPRVSFGGELHQGRLYLWDEEDVVWSMTGRSRVFFGGNRISFPEAGRIVGGKSIQNALYLFGENEVYMWRGLSGAQMDATRPIPIFGQGLKSGNIRDLSWVNTIQRAGKKIFFVDREGYARMIVGERVLYLSTDGKKKMNIPGKILDSVIVNNTYRILDGDYEYVCFLGGNPPYRWTRWRNEAKRYMYPRYNNLLDRIEYVE